MTICFELRSRLVGMTVRQRGGFRRAALSGKERTNKAFAELRENRETKLWLYRITIGMPEPVAGIVEMGADGGNVCLVLK